MWNTKILLDIVTSLEQRTASDNILIQEIDWYIHVHSDHSLSQAQMQQQDSKDYEIMLALTKDKLLFPELHAEWMKTLVQYHAMHIMQAEFSKQDTRA